MTRCRGLVKTLLYQKSDPSRRVEYEYVGIFFAKTRAIELQWCKIATIIISSKPTFTSFLYKNSNKQKQIRSFSGSLITNLTSVVRLETSIPRYVKFYHKIFLAKFGMWISTGQFNSIPTQKAVNQHIMCLCHLRFFYTWDFSTLMPISFT